LAESGALCEDESDDEAATILKPKEKSCAKSERVGERIRGSKTKPKESCKEASRRAPTRSSDGRKGKGRAGEYSEEESADIEMDGPSRRSSLNSSALEVRTHERRAGRGECLCPAPCTHERGAGRSGGRSARSASSGLHPVPCTHERAAELKQERPLEPLEPLERPASKKKHKYESARRQLD